jgi:hypothetical protein
MIVYLPCQCLSELLSTRSHETTIDRMAGVHSIEELQSWLKGPRDIRAQALVQARIEQSICRSFTMIVALGLECLCCGSIMALVTGTTNCQHRGSMVVILFIGSDNSSKAKYSNYAYDLGRKIK